MSFYCGVATQPACVEKCCFLCDDVGNCKFECGLSGMDDACVYKDDEPDTEEDY